MNSGIVDITSAWSPRPSVSMLADMPPNSASNARGRLSAPSTAAPSMIVNSGAPLTNASVSSAIGTDVR